ncbi:DUF3124 domain-containing protein [Rubinisphaera italica]|nr:DUF3124 domain-containing protein [Rubinisphaera italica]
MMAKTIEDEADAFMRRFKLILFVCGALLTVPLMIYAIYLDTRLDSFENTMQYRPPMPTSELLESRLVNMELYYPIEGQTVYVPAYSHVYHGDGKPQLLTNTLSIRNTDLENDIVVTSVKYYDTTGKMVKSHLERPQKLGPLATTEFLVERKDATGGSGANFIVEWHADEPVSAPIIETVMIDTSSQQGISFVRQGKVIKQTIFDATTQKSNNENAPSEPDSAATE